MKESIGAFSLFNIVIVFVLIFAGYISMSINYSKAYNVKNELLNIIKNQGGVCSSSNRNSECYAFSQQVTDYFQEANYRSTGVCEDGWVGYNREGLLDSSNSAFCVKAIEVRSNTELPNAVYYQVKVFYQLDLPIIRSFFEFSITGETGRVFEPNECAQQSSQYEWCR